MKPSSLEESLALFCSKTTNSCLESTALRTTLSTTVTVQLADNSLPSTTFFAVITVEPTFKASTTPASLTLATVASEDDQVTVLSSNSLEKLACNVSLSPIRSVTSFLLMEIVISVSALLDTLLDVGSLQETKFVRANKEIKNILTCLFFILLPRFR